MAKTEASTIMDKIIGPIQHNPVNNYNKQDLLDP